jgi:hypothetical protein
VTCLAYYLTHARSTQSFKTKELTALNTEAAGGKLSNISGTARNAVTKGFLSGAGAGNKQITARGEAIVEALPDRERLLPRLKHIRLASLARNVRQGRRSSGAQAAHHADRCKRSEEEPPRKPY